MAHWVHPYQVVPGVRIYNSVCNSIEYCSTATLCILVAPRRNMYDFGVFIPVLTPYIYIYIYIYRQACEWLL